MSRWAVNMGESFLKWDSAALAINGLQVLIGYQAFLIERRTSAATHQYLMRSRFGAIANAFGKNL